MKRCIVILVVLAALFAACGASFAAEKTWKLAHIRPEGTAIDIALKQFAADVKARTDGRVDIEIFPAGQLGDYTTVQERVAIGDVEMQCAPLSPAVIKSIGLNSFPYIVVNWPEAQKAFGPDGVIVKKMNEYMAQQDLHVIGSWPVYFGGVVLTTEPAAPKDPSVPKGVKIRVPPIRSFELSATSLGYQATPVPWADTFTAMQTGIVNGAIGGGAEGYFASFRDLAKYYLAVNDHFECWFIYVNSELWSKVSDEDKKTLEDIAREMQEARWKVAVQDELDNEQKLADIGVQIIKFTDDELSLLRDKHAKEVWPAMYDEIPEADVKEVLDSLK
ncbi:MAG: TRAP transporter substrate-binding protein DctP [Synergistaceae bacterium]|jgi:TRAP-type C4-dicarboxylate transport system substrate-binding protein|nr:TRAP transporter substrate-binding protein DctP [Synergistaceae bacterium]